MSSPTMEKEQVGSLYAAESQSEGSSSPGEAQPLQQRQRKSKKTNSTKKRQQSQSGPLSNVGGLDNLPTGDLTNQASGAVNGVTNTLGSVANNTMDNVQQQSGGGDGGGKSDTLRLRLDLNLEVEIQLKARIHGDLELALLTG